MHILNALRRWIDLKEIANVLLPNLCGRIKSKIYIQNVLLATMQRNLLTFFEFIRGILASIRTESSRSTPLSASNRFNHLKRHKYNHNGIQ